MKLLDAIANQAAVDLELRLSRTAQADATLLAFKVGPAAHQTRGQMFELCEFDLQLTFARACALSEDIEDKTGAVEHPAADGLFEIAFLRRRERVIEEYDIDVFSGGARANFLGLALADEGGWIGFVATAGDGAANSGARGLREQTQFFEILGRVPSIIEPQLNQQGAFSPAARGHH